MRFEFIIAVLIVGLTSTAHGAATRLSNSSNRATFFNPVLDAPWPDPYVYLHSDGAYYMTRSEPKPDPYEIALYKSRSLTDWRNAGRRLIYRAPEGLKNLWAPEMHYIQGSWYIYFALDDGDNANHRMYVISCHDENPMLGTWSREQRMIVPGQDYWAIDGTVLPYDNGQLYFLWSGWPELDSGFPQNLYIAPMSDPVTISGPRVLIREPVATWETIAAPIIEGPQIIQHMNRTFVIYSASGSWTADYCLGMIGIDELKDPLVRDNWWQDVDRPVFWRNDAERAFGVGHASFTTSPDGTQEWIIYHGMEDPDAGWLGRTARAQEFGWNPDNSPAFPRPAGLGTPLETPSGQQ